MFLFFNFKLRKRRFFGRKTISLSVPQTETSSTKLSLIDEYISSSPTYQTVPDFQRVQITGDYASGVSCFLPPRCSCWEILSLIVSASFLPPLPFEGVSSLALCYTSLSHFNSNMLWIREIFYFTYFWMCWVFIALHSFSLVVASRSYSS